jgi:NAD(P)-dependent dehydrogenase (short-subunit alcohol dehydrogenase family)
MPIAVITGGTAGVGRAAVREFASHGYDVGVFARGRDGLTATVAEAEQAGVRAVGRSVDVADLDAVRAAAHDVERELGEIDVWVNVAFVGLLEYFWDTTPEEYRRVTEVTYYGQVHGTWVALELMRPRNRGVIIQCGSALAYRGIPLQAAYCGAKHAIKGFTESVITELRHERSRVRMAMVELPGLNTPQFDWNLNKMGRHPMPVPPIFQPEVAGRAIRFVAEHPRRNIWVGPPTALTILGNRVAPRLLDWYLGRTGVDSQLTDEPLPRYRPNVFEPAPGDHGAHGSFDHKAHGGDPLSWASMHRRALLGGLTGLTAAALAGRRLVSGSANGRLPAP